MSLADANLFVGRKTEIRIKSMSLALTCDWEEEAEFWVSGGVID